MPTGLVPTSKNEVKAGRAVEATPIVPARGTQRQVDLWEFKASLVYRRSSTRQSQEHLTPSNTQNTHSCLAAVSQHRAGWQTGHVMVGLNHMLDSSLEVLMSFPP